MMYDFMFSQHKTWRVNKTIQKQICFLVNIRKGKRKGGYKRHFFKWERPKGKRTVK